MADVFTPEKRSEVMSRIRGRHTKPERLVRSILHRLGYRFTVNGPRNKRLPGKPDIVLPKHHTLVFVHGCFWHGHHGCDGFRLPKSRSEWWEAKIAGNRTRDARHESELRRQGWNVVIIWACELKNKAAALQHRLPCLIEPVQPAKIAEEAKPYRPNGEPPAPPDGSDQSAASWPGGSNLRSTGTAEPATPTRPSPRPGTAEPQLGENPPCMPIKPPGTPTPPHRSLLRHHADAGDDPRSGHR